MLEKIEKPEIETVKLEPNGTYGMFVLAPLERGYGTTLGNCVVCYSPRFLALPSSL